MTETAADITEQWTRTPADAAAVREGCYFDLEAAERVRTFFRRFLRHSKGVWAGKPFELLEWQWAGVIAPLFGWKRADGSRRYRKAFVEIPKKNGKSTLAAGIGLYLLIGDNEPGAHVFSTAAKREQAGIVHGEAVSMVERSPGLSSFCTINRSTHEIRFPRASGLYRALAADAGGSEGLNAHGIVIDELHAWTGEHGRNFFNSLRYAARARRQGLIFIITTAGDDELSICYDEYQYAKSVLAGEVIDARYFAYIAEADPADDWTDPAVWRKANPSLGPVFSEEDFAGDVREAMRSPTATATFKRYGLNIWTRGATPALSSVDWQACRREYTAEELTGRECWAGLDLSRTRDMSALVLLFPSEDGTYRTLPYFWLPENRVNDPASPEHYRVWASQGHLTATPGDVCDYRVILAKLIELGERYAIQELAFDPYNAERLTQDFVEATGVTRVSFPQTMVNYAAPTGEFERLVLSHAIHHNGNPVLGWQAGHVAWRVDLNNNKRPIKPGDRNPYKIDGIVAAIMALARAMLVYGRDVPTITW